MGLGGLDIALSGLNIAQQQLSLISNNIANVNTPGYSRKILPQEGRSVNGVGIGVKANPVVRNVDLNLARDFWTQVSAVNGLDVKANYLEKIQQFHGPPDSEISVAAELGQLRDAFSSLADSPEDTFLQRSTIEQATFLANKINSLEDLLTQSRNDLQDDMELSVETINDSLQQIASLNSDIRVAKAANRSSADLEDQRDQAVRTLANEMEVSFFTRGDGVMVVQTVTGYQLADERAETLTFVPDRIDTSSYYPNNVSGVYIGEPGTDVDAADITTPELGGKLGAYLELRDEIFPTQQAMLDEFAFQTASRFQSQGLTLFTNADGFVPDGGPPDTVNGTPVDYVGFSGEMRVNQRILDDNTLIQQGTSTTDLGVQSGSNEVVRRVLEFSFGEVSYQQASGDVDLRTGGAQSLQQVIGIYSESRAASSINLTSFSDVDAIVTSANGALDDPNDQFDIVFDDPDMVNAPISATPKTITVDLSAAQLEPGANAAEKLQAHIDTLLAAAPAIDVLWDVQVDINVNGQLVIQSRGNIEIDATNGANAMGQAGLDFLGLTDRTYEAVDPYFDIQVGNDPVVRITLGPLDDETDLFDALDHDGTGADQGVPGLAVDNDLTDALGNGFLTLRPGDSTVNPGFGGDLRIIGGPFETAGGANVVEALFGAQDPITSVGFGVETDTGSGIFVDFRATGLGPNTNINTGIVSSSTILDFGQKMINRQTEESVSAINLREGEETFRNLLEQTYLNQSGVNLEEELSNLIQVQSAFSASARVVQAIDEQFQELLRAI